MRLASVALCTMGILLVGCSDDDKPKDLGSLEASVDGLTPDLGVDMELTPDASKPDAPPLDQNMGEGCKTNADCKKGSPDCLVLSTKKQLGICSMACTADDATTPLINEDNCPSGFVCASFRYTSQTFHYCLKNCTPDITKNTCPATSKQACHPASTRFGDTDQAVCWYLACEDGKDCPVYSQTTCYNDGDCTALGTGAFCDSAAGKCAKPGNCTASGLCGKHTHGKATAKVGDPCKDDFDCPGAGSCFEESTDSSYIGLGWRNGYCTISSCAFSATMPDNACPAGSTCNHLFYGGVCAKTCKLDDATSCRGNASDKGGDYECYAWNNLYLGNVQITKEPVCATAAGQTCDSMGTQLDCSSLGEQGNPTNMSCRDRFNGTAKANQADPMGVCLDDTASGPFAPAPDGGVADVGTPDVGTPDAQTPDAGTPDVAQADL